MQVIKPQALGLSTRPIEYRKRFGLCVTAMLYVPFAQGEHGTLWSEQSMWNFLGTEMAVPMIDEGVAKLTPEFLVHGRAFPPPERRDACAVRARFGNRSKTLLVFGDRHWNGDRASEPAPFESLPIDWPHAYGGPGHASNPAGLGYSPQQGVHRLPNIEHPEQLLRTAAQRVEPVGFGPLAPDHPQRAKYRGTYDARYLEEHAPGFAPDLDWKHFNLAPTDQWMDASLRGDEPFQFDHMHPTQPRIAGQLPGLRVRVFADYRLPGESRPHLREVPLRLTTAWFFPHAERAVLLYQGLAEVSTDDGSDVWGLLGAVERLEQAQPDAHYIEALDRRADPRWGGIHSLDDSDLLPAGLDVADPEAAKAAEAFAAEGLQGEAQRRRAAIDIELAREEVRATGRDPDAMGIVMPPREVLPKPHEVASYLKQQLKKAETQQLHALNDMLVQIEKAQAIAKEHKIDLGKLKHRGPPLFSAQAEFTQLSNATALARSKLDTAQLLGHLLKKEDAERQAYLQAAHEQPPVDPMPTADAAALREEMKRAVASGLRMLAGVDLTGADFSGLDLRDIDFTGAWLESANLSGANLSGAKLSHAVLAHANLDNAIGIGTVFAGANLGRTRWAGAVFDEADFSEAVLSHAQLDGVSLQRAKLAGARLLDTVWKTAHAGGVVAPEQLFHKLDLAGVKFTEADLAGAQFIECDLSGCDLRGARLVRATFVTCKLDGASLAGANAEGAVFAERCSLAGADFARAVLRSVNFGAADMTGTRGVASVLDGANLCEARMEDCDWRLASAQGALLRRTVLRRARLAGVNFRDAVLQHADLRGADLRDSSLFGADLSRVRLDGDVRLDNALLKRARTWPRLSAAQQVEGA